MDEAGLIAYTGGLSNRPAQNIYVYAQWEAIDFTFTFDPNFGTGANVVQPFNIGGSVAGTTFARPGFTFVGWTLDEAGLVAYTGGLTNLPAQNIYVYAQWGEVLGEDESPTLFTLNFVTNMDGISFPPVLFEKGDSVTPPKPTKEGYIFLGWFMDEEFSEEFDFSFMPENDVTVFADWGQVLGEDDEIPDTSDDLLSPLAFLLFIIGLIAVIFFKKEEVV